MLRKEMYTWFFVCFSIQGRQKRITTLTGVRAPPPHPYLTSSPVTSAAFSPSSAGECLDMRPHPHLLGQPDESDHRFKIDLCIFIYVYIKKERGRGAIRWISSTIPYAVSGGRRWSPGIRARGGRGEADAETGEAGRGGGRGSSVCSWVRLVCVECQLIMSLLLTPYVEFFMLSLTSLLNTDRFCVNLQSGHKETDRWGEESPTLFLFFRTILTVF